MKRFQFRLQAVLTLRLRAEHDALAIYANALQVGRMAREKVVEAEALICDARRRWLNALADGLPAARATQMRSHNHWLEERKRQSEQLLQSAEKEIEQASQRMIQARQQREAVETHLVSQREKHQNAAANEERQLIDDLVQARIPLRNPYPDRAGEIEMPPVSAFPTPQARASS